MHALSARIIGSIPVSTIYSPQAVLERYWCRLLKGAEKWYQRKLPQKLAALSRSMMILVDFSYYDRKVHKFRSDFR